MLEFRTGGAQIAIPGVRVVQAGGGAVDWWQVAGQTCVAAYAAKGAASLVASYVNLATPGTFDAAPGVAPTFDTATGWTFNGTTQYLTTGVTAGAAYTMILRYSNCAYTSGDCWAGAYTGSGAGYLMQMITSAGNRYRFFCGGLLVVGTFAAAATLAIAGRNFYVDGAYVGTQPSGTPPVLPAYLGAINSDSTPINFANTQIQAVAIYSTTLDAAQVAALTARMNLL